MQIFTRLEDKRKTYRVGIDRQFSPTPRYITPLESGILPPMAPNLHLQPVSEVVEEFIPITKKNHLLENVTVEAKRRYFTNDDWKYKNESWGRNHAAVFYDIDRELDNIRDLGEEDPSIFEFFCRKNSLFNNPECKTCLCRLMMTRGFGEDIFPMPTAPSSGLLTMEKPK